MPGAYRQADATVSARRAAVATLSDSANIECSRALYIGTSGNLKVTMVEGGDVTFNNLVAGTVLPIQVTRLWLTGTTAAMNILILY